MVERLKSGSQSALALPLSIQSLREQWKIIAECPSHASLERKICNAIEFLKEVRAASRNKKHNDFVIGTQLQHIRTLVGIV
jgi:hypothetical protein